MVATESRTPSQQPERGGQSVVTNGHATPPAESPSNGQHPLQTAHEWLADVIETHEEAQRGNGSLDTPEDTTALEPERSSLVVVSPDYTRVTIDGNPEVVGSKVFSAMLQVAVENFGVNLPGAVVREFARNKTGLKVRKLAPSIVGIKPRLRRLLVRRGWARAATWGVNMEYNWRMEGSDEILKQKTQDEKPATPKPAIPEPTESTESQNDTGQTKPTAILARDGSFIIVNEQRIDVANELLRKTLLYLSDHLYEGVKTTELTSFRKAMKHSYVDFSYLFSKLPKGIVTIQGRTMQATRSLSREYAWTQSINDAYFLEKFHGKKAVPAKEILDERTVQIGPDFSFVVIKGERYDIPTPAGRAMLSHLYENRETRVKALELFMVARNTGIKPYKDPVDVLDKLPEAVRKLWVEEVVDMYLTFRMNPAHLYRRIDQPTGKDQVSIKKTVPSVPTPTPAPRASAATEKTSSSSASASWKNRPPAPPPAAVTRNPNPTPEPRTSPRLDPFIPLPFIPRQETVFPRDPLSEAQIQTRVYTTVSFLSGIYKKVFLKAYFASDYEQSFLLRK